MHSISSRLVHAVRSRRQSNIDDSDPESCIDPFDETHGEDVPLFYFMLDSLMSLQTTDRLVLRYSTTMLVRLVQSRPLKPIAIVWLELASIHSPLPRRLNIVQ